MFYDRCCFGIGDKLVGLGFVCNQHRAMGRYSKRDRRVPQQPSLVKGGTGKSLSSQAWLKEVLDVPAE